MRIAVISDIHGNIHALEALLEDVAKQQVDEIIFAGDTRENALKPSWHLVALYSKATMKNTFTRLATTQPSSN
jgi:predicted phosphodiesterase